MQGKDTSPAAMRRYVELLRRMTPVERLEAAAALSQAAREMTLVGIRMRNPDASEEEVRRLFREQVYGPPGKRGPGHP